jgi:hypothetical protein
VNVEHAYLFQDVLILPTRLSTKLTFRSHWRTRGGGHLGWAAPTLVLLGCCLCSGATSAGIFFGQKVVVILSQVLVVGIKEGGQYSAVSNSEEEVVVEESSDVCEEASDQTDAEEDEAEEAMEELYGPF